MIRSSLSRIPHAQKRMPAPVALVLAMVVLHTGSAFATRLFDDMAPLGVTWLRLTWAALILVAVSGRSLLRAVRAASARDLLSAALLGAFSGAMMLFYSEATARIHLGTATALEFLGPLAVAVLAMRRRREIGWVVLAVAGVALLTRPWGAEADFTGMAFALGSAACWSGYIVIGQRIGNRFSVVHALALAMIVASVASAPMGVPRVLADPSPQVIAATLGIAVLMPLVPFLLELAAMRRMGSTTYGTLASLEPAVSLMMGLLLISQTPAPIQVLGTILVVVAGAGAARDDGAVVQTPQEPAQRAGVPVGVTPASRPPDAPSRT